MTIESKNLATTLRENWIVLVFITSIIVGWTQLNATASSNSLRIDKLESTAIASQSDINSVKSDLVEIKTTLLFIKEQVSTK